MAGLNGASDVVISDFGNTYNDLLYVLYDVLFCMMFCMMFVHAYTHGGRVC